MLVLVIHTVVEVFILSLYTRGFIKLLLLVYSDWQWIRSLVDDLVLLFEWAQEILAVVFDYFVFTAGQFSSLHGILQEMNHICLGHQSLILEFLSILQLFFLPIQHLLFFGLSFLVFILFIEEVYFFLYTGYSDLGLHRFVFWRMHFATFALIYRGHGWVSQHFWCLSWLWLFLISFSHNCVWHSWTLFIRDHIHSTFRHYKLTTFSFFWTNWRRCFTKSSLFFFFCLILFF